MFQTFDIREASTQATTDLFQKIGERQDTFYQDAPTTKKDLHVINSEPLSTNSEKGMAIDKSRKFEVAGFIANLATSNLRVLDELNHFDVKNELL